MSSFANYRSARNRTGRHLKRNNFLRAVKLSSCFHEKKGKQRKTASQNGTQQSRVKRGIISWVLVFSFKRVSGRGQNNESIRNRPFFTCPIVVQSPSLFTLRPSRVACLLFYRILAWIVPNIEASLNFRGEPLKVHLLKKYPRSVTEHVQNELVFVLFRVRTRIKTWFQRDTPCLRFSKECVESCTILLDRRILFLAFCLQAQMFH